MDIYNFFLAFSRLAPVQVVTHGIIDAYKAIVIFIILIGHASTTGIPNLDYFVSYKPFEISTAQDHYTEKLVTFSDFSPYSKVRSLQLLNIV